jgi:hypothetical protein
MVKNQIQNANLLTNCKHLQIPMLKYNPSKIQISDPRGGGRGGGLPVSSASRGAKSIPYAGLVDCNI